MKESLSSLDLVFLIEELQSIVGSKIQKVKQAGQTIAFELYKEKESVLKVRPHSIYLSVAMRAEDPTDFCMSLRKHLTGKEITGLRQHKFDRVIEIDIEEFTLIIELFSTGNIVLVQDGLIKAVMHRQQWSSRTLKIKEVYKHPPSNVNPFAQDFLSLQKAFQVDKELVKFLATDLGFGGTYAEELCQRTGIEKTKTAKLSTQQEIDKLFRTLQEIKDSPKPQIIFEDGQQADVVPFSLIIYAGKERKEFPNFNEAVREYFETLEQTELSEAELAKQEREQQKLEKIKESHRTQLEQLGQQRQYYEKAAKLIYQNFAEYTKILALIKQLKERKVDWQRIIDQVKMNPMVKELEPDDALLVVEAEDIEIDLDFRKTVKEIANEHFEKAKAAKAKIEKIQKSLVKFEPKPRPAAKIEEQWYEKYRWFFSSDGILVIAGRNAEQNEELIKSQCRPYDTVLHADIHGSPFAVIRNDVRKKLSEQTLREAAEFVASYSRAWLLKITVDVYAISPDQLVKTAGLPTGSFLIKGERKWFNKVEPKLALAFTDRLIAGPVEVIKKQTLEIVTIVPGDNDKIADEIKKKINASLEEISKAVPYGRGEVTKS